MISVRQNASYQCRFLTALDHVMGIRTQRGIAKPLFDILGAIPWWAVIIAIDNMLDYLLGKTGKKDDLLKAIKGLMLSGLGFRRGLQLALAILFLFLTGIAL